MMAYSTQYPLGRRLKASRTFFYDGCTIHKGETGEVTCNGANSLTVRLDADHASLEDNSLFMEPAEWGIGRSFTDDMSRDRFYGVRHAMNHRLGVALLLLTALLAPSPLTLVYAKVINTYLNSSSEAGEH